MGLQTLRSWLLVGSIAAACFIVGAGCNKTGAAKKISPAAAKQSRLDWNIKTLVGAYQDIGSTDAKWDAFATNALAEFARSRTQSFDADEDWQTIIRTNCEAAAAAGCDDPMMGYLHIRFCMSQTNSPKAFADAFCKVAAAMQSSDYPNIRKFYASLRALEQTFYAVPRTNRDSQFIGELANNLVDNLTKTVADKTVPPEEIYEACHAGLEQLGGSQSWYERCYQQIEPSLFANWPQEDISWLIKGEVEIAAAWFARGGGYANTVSEAQWKAYGLQLSAAEKSLNKAWKLNPKDSRIPLQMMRVELGQGNGRETMELWFNRAMTLDPNDYDACYSKLYYLEPKWYGSKEDMLAFGRECVRNEKWGGHVPLILLDAHKTIRSSYTDDAAKDDYWKQPEVWADLQAAFDRFFELNPDATGWYHDYAWYAYHAEQWGKLNELIPKLGPVNYAYFGGEDEFNKMIQLAKEHAGKSKAEPAK